MNCLIVLLVYLLNIRNDGNLCEVQKVYFLESKCWCDDQVQNRTDKRYLSRLVVGVDFKSDDIRNYSYYKKSFFPLKSTSTGYFVLPQYIGKEINSIVKSSRDQKICLRFNFSFTDKLIKNSYDFENYKGIVQECLAYKLLKKKFDNSITMKTEGTGIHMEYVKDRFIGLISMKLLNFNKYIQKISKKELMKELDKPGNDLTFNYFESYSECLENLEEFIQNLSRFKLLKDDVFDSSKMSIDKTTTLKVSRFKERLHRKFFRDLKEMYGITADETWKTLFNRCFNYLNDKILHDNVFLPIKDEYNIIYYIGHLSKMIFESIKDKRRDYANAECEDKDNIFLKMNRSLKVNLEKLQVRIARDLGGSIYVYDHFSNLLASKVETFNDFIEAEKMMCDYFNIFVFIFNLYQKSRDSYSYVTPIIDDDYNLMIIDGIKIELDISLQFGKIKGFDDKGKYIKMKKDTDYFIDESAVLFCPSKVLKMKKIYEIEIISLDEETIMRFKIDNYLINK